jgi:transcription antitermination factor NusG
MHTRLIEATVAGETLPAWYAIYTKHQHEKVATDLLGRKGFEVFLPSYRVASRWKDRTKTITLPLFPCYSFVRASLTHKTDILRTPGVFWLVETGGRACPIPDYEIDMIRRITQASAKAEPHPFLKCGHLVRVRDGALKGLEGILIQVKNQHRVVVRIEVLKKAVAVEVEFSMLERVRSQRESASLVSGEDRREGQRSDHSIPFKSALETTGMRIG